MNQRSMVESAMGDSFARLPVAVQRFHRLSGRTVLHGWVETDAPASIAARGLAFCLGSPQRAGSGPIRFELDASAESESWTRHFPTHTMRSRLQLIAGKLEEKLGAARLRFELSASDDALKMELSRMWFLGVPCPRWLMPQVVAEERGDGKRVHFRVAAALPRVGVVAGYRGHLDLDPEVRS